jgi:hypothetical protein
VNVVLVVEDSVMVELLRLVLTLVILTVVENVVALVL